MMMTDDRAEQQGEAAVTAVISRAVDAAAYHLRPLYEAADGRLGPCTTWAVGDARAVLYAPDGLTGHPVEHVTLALTAYPRWVSGTASHPVYAEAQLVVIPLVEEWIWQQTEAVKPPRSGPLEGWEAEVLHVSKGQSAP